MTPSDMHQTPEPAPRQDDLDARAVEAALSGAQPTGDAALDEALAGLRSLVSTTPEPNAELARLLGPAGSSPAAEGDEVGRRRQGGARHLATGTTIVVGVVLATATAAAAMGGLGGFEHAPAPRSHPTVDPSPRVSTPHPVGTTPTQLPALPLASTDPSHDDSDPATLRHAKGSPSSKGLRGPRSSDDADEDRDSATRDTRQTHDDADDADHDAAEAHDEGDEQPSSTGDRDDGDGEGGGDGEERSSHTGDGDDEQATSSGTSTGTGDEDDDDSAESGSAHGGDAAAL